MIKSYVPIFNEEENKKNNIKGVIQKKPFLAG
jgi:hypothetical protein